MARITRRLERAEKAMQEQEARRGALSFPAELGMIALVSPVTKQPVEYYDLVSGKFVPVESRIEGRG